MTRSPSDATLYEITAEFLALEDLLEQQAEAEINGTEADADVVSRWLEELSGARDSKITRCAQYVLSQEAIEESLRAEARRLSARADVHAGRVRRLKAAMLEAMEVTGIRKVEGIAGCVSVAQNGGKEPMQIDLPPERMPPELVMLVPTIDKEAARAALEQADGKTTTWGRLLPRGKHVRIR